MRLVLSVSVVLSALGLALPAAAAPLYTVPPPSVEQIAEAIENTSGGWRFALPVSISIDAQHDGVWIERGEIREWTATIFAAGADSLSVRFDSVSLPPGAELTLESVSGAPQVQGPYTEESFRNGMMRTAMLLTDQVRLRLVVPIGGEVQLRTESVDYGFRDAFVSSAKAGDCNIDTACPEADEFRNQVNSTVRLDINGTACTGLLVNNVREDLTPYLMTADHCGINSSNDQNLIAYFKFERDTCAPGSHREREPTNSTMNIRGAELLARGQDSDFALLVLGSRDNPIVPPENFSPYWSGWDVGQEAPQNGIGVHHPLGQEKAISFFDDPAKADTHEESLGRPVETWRVIWNVGTTEGGSSGSGLWNQDGRVVGVLTGGAASCSNQTGPDFYGRSNVAWTEENRCDRQLRFWLDPDFSGTEVADGTDGSNRSADPVVPACNPSTPLPSPTPSPTPTSTPQPTPTPSGGGGGGSSGSSDLALLFLLLAAGVRRRGHRRVMSAV